MVFAVDIGNTNIVIGCCRDNKIIFVERVSTKPDATVLEYAISFKSILEFYGIAKEDIDGAIISSVVPSVTSTVHSAIEKVMDLYPECENLKEAFKAFLEDARKGKLDFSLNEQYSLVIAR